jgi:hypothetical protein
VVATDLEGVMADCRVYWGSHGCDLDRGHDGLCECGCCDCPDGAHNGVTAPADDEGVLCVAKSPYYGPETEFYGEDAKARKLW